MSEIKFNLSGHLWGINRAHKIYLEHHARKCDVTLGQYPYLVYINYFPNFNQDDLAKLFQKDKCGVSRTLKKLEEKKLVNRQIDPENRRRYKITLTPEGKKIADYLKKKDDEWEDMIYNNLDISREEVERIIKNLFKKSTEFNESLK